MPIYAYKCESCGKALDVLQKMSDPVLVDCPACGAPKLQKQLTAAGFQLKGSGWYATDFKGGAAPAAEAEAAVPSDGGAKATETVAGSSAAPASATTAAPATAPVATPAAPASPAAP